MAYQIATNFAGNSVGYSTSNNGKKAEFTSMQNDPIKSPVNGDVKEVGGDFVEIKDDKNFIFKISNIAPIIGKGNTVNLSSKIGNAKGKISLEISESSLFGGAQKVEEFLNFKEENKEKPDKGNGKQPDDPTPREKELWRYPIELYYAPLGMAVDVAKQGLQKVSSELGNLTKKKEGKEEKLDETLIEEIKRIKKLLK